MADTHSFRVTRGRGGARAAGAAGAAGKNPSPGRSCRSSMGHGHPDAGSIEVICGSMFSGKTEELIRRLRRAQFAKQDIQVFKPRIDTRYSVTDVASHNKSLLPSIVIEQAAEIYRHLRPETHVVGIDEGQFFDEELVDVADDLAERGIRVVIAGLDMDWKGEPFHPMPALMAIAETVHKLHAVCMVCGAPAARTQRLSEDPSAILIGDHNSYEARCRGCFDPTLASELIADLKAGQEDDEEFDAPVSLMDLRSPSSGAIGSLIRSPNATQGPSPHGRTQVPSPSDYL